MPGCLREPNWCWWRLMTINQTLDIIHHTEMKLPILVHCLSAMYQNWSFIGHFSCSFLHKFALFPFLNIHTHTQRTHTHNAHTLTHIHMLPPKNENKSSFRNVLYADYYVKFLSQPCITDSSKLHSHFKDSSKEVIFLKISWPNFCCNIWFRWHIMQILAMLSHQMLPT